MHKAFSEIEVRQFYRDTVSVQVLALNVKFDIEGAKTMSKLRKGLMAVGAVAIGLGITDAYRIRSMKVSVDVPEPASVLGLLGFGAVAAGAVLKRKHEQTT